MNGWIKLHRSMLKWEWYDDTNTKVLFLHLLLSANHEEGHWRGVKIDKGSLITGRIKLAKETGLSEQIIRTCLDRLISTNEITIKTTNKYSIISINKWEEYQCYDDLPTNKITNKITNKQPTNNQQITNKTTNKKCEILTEKWGEITNSKEIATNDKLTYDQKNNHKQEYKNKEIINNILLFFNSKTGKNYKETKSLTSLINARLEEGFTEEDFKKVISTKTNEWKDNPKMNKYLRPQTLFIPSHFQDYLNQESDGEETIDTKEYEPVDMTEKWEDYKKKKGIKND